MDMSFEIVSVQKPDNVNVIIGQAHFIKTVEDLYEAVIASVPSIRFGLAFCEASGACLVRFEGSDDELTRCAVDNITRIGCGHTFFIALKDAYPINVLNQIKNVAEVASIYCATANELQVIVAVTAQGRGVMGVIDGSSPKGIEGQEDRAWRKGLLRKIGYKL